MLFGKKLIAAVLTMGMLTSNIAYLPISSIQVNAAEAVAEEEVHIWDGTSDISWYDDEETEFHISTAEKLAGLAELVNNGNDFISKTIYLENDIYLNDISNYSNWDKEPPSNSWTPIGMIDDSKGGFNGTFDGQKHTIYGFYYSKELYSMKYVGLFGYANENSIIKNTSTAYVYLSGTTNVDKYIGGVCGYNNNKSIWNCSSSGNFFVEISEYPKTDTETLYVRVGGICGATDSGHAITNCQNSADVTTSTFAIKCNYVGGIVGSACNVQNCINSGSISSKSEKRSFAGGICGFGGANINKCINCGNVVSQTLLGVEYNGKSGHSSCCAGGISGVNGRISYCINYNSLIKCSHDSGGIVGSIPQVVKNNINKGNVEGACAGGIAGYASGCDFENNYSIGKIDGYLYEGEIIAYKDSFTTNVKNCYSRKNMTEEEMKTEAFAECLGSAFVYVENDYPMLFIFVDYFKKESTVSGDVNLDGEFNVTDVVLLQKWLLAVPNTELKYWENADYCEDGKLNAFDLCLMKRDLISQ